MREGREQMRERNSTGEVWNFALIFNVHMNILAVAWLCWHRSVQPHCTEQMHKCTTIYPLRQDSSLVKGTLNLYSRRSKMVVDVPHNSVTPPTW